MLVDVTFARVERCQTQSVRLPVSVSWINQGSCLLSSWRDAANVSSGSHPVAVWRLCGLCQSRQIHPVTGGSSASTLAPVRRPGLSRRIGAGDSRKRCLRPHHTLAKMSDALASLHPAGHRVEQLFAYFVIVAHRTREARFAGRMIHFKYIGRDPDGEPTRDRGRRAPAGDFFKPLASPSVPCPRTRPAWPRRRREVQRGRPDRQTARPSF
jgi:hypothetical protein